ncbi:hypothetical protein [Natronococcus pandeyae]|nr:hypothetical protein [Natronococcus pandeyae]
MQTTQAEDVLTVIALLRLSFELGEAEPYISDRAYWLAKGIAEELD